MHQPWIDKNENQACGGLAYLNELAEKAGEGWLGGTDHISQADISAVVAFSFARKIRPNMDVVKRFPALAAFAERCEARETFRKAPVPG